MSQSEITILLIANQNASGAVTKDNFSFYEGTNQKASIIITVTRPFSTVTGD